MSNVSRTEYAVRNIFWGNIGHAIIILLQFASRTVFIYTIGITYLGINGLFTNVLGLLSFAELGIGVAMNYSLYKPMADKDYEKLKSLMLVYKRAYRFIAIVITIIGLIILPFLSNIIKGGEGIEQIPVFYLIFLFNTVSSYFITYKYSIVTAAQKGYLLTNIDSAVRSFIVILQIVVLLVFESFLAYLLVQSVIQLIQKIATAKYINRKYPFLLEKNVEPLDSKEKERIKTDVKALIVHKLGDISVYQTDSIIISSFINITVVGLVSNYNMLLMSITAFLTVIFNSLLASLGNLIATESIQHQLKIFKAYNFLGFWLYGFTSICFIILIQPFISLWIGADKQIDNLSMILIMTNQYFLGQRITMTNFKTAGGIFKQDRIIPVIQAIVNLVVSIVLVNIIGLPGIFIGTLVQGLISNVWRPIIVYRILFNSKSVLYFKDFFKYLFVTVITLLSMVLTAKYILSSVSILRFILMALIVGIVPNLFFYSIFRKSEEFIIIQQKMKEMLKGRWKNV